MLMHGYAFHPTPSKSGSLNLMLAFHNLVDCPHLTIRDVMQRRDDSRSTSLTNVAQAHGIIRAVPTESLFAEYHILKTLKPPSTTATVPVTNSEASLMR